MEETSYYIETSNGKIFFLSSDLKNMHIHNNYYESNDEEYIFQNCKFITDIHFLTKIFNNSNWSDIHIVYTENDHFLIIVDDNGGPQYAEYKIFEYKDIFQDKL